MLLMGFALSACVLVIGYLVKLYFAQGKVIDKFGGIPDLSAENAKLLERRSQLLSQYDQLKTECDRLAKESEVFLENSEMISYGFYTPKYDFLDSESYKQRLDEVRGKQKQMIKEKSAIVCATEWSVEGSKSKGRAMTNKTIKLALNAFNVQCDNAILKVKFNSIHKAEERLEKIQLNINKLLEPNHCEITSSFYDLKQEELSLAFEYQEKVAQEKEEQRLIREQMKEEEKAKREYEKAQADSEKEERMYEKALEQAQRDLSKASESEKQILESKLAELQAKLKAAHEKKERVLSMAQQTKRGHVYVISNIGSFGESVFKIGMTRRLDPIDRVKELGDASVPFKFDVHAIIFSENAPEMEANLHRHFDQSRVNRINNRKEFFKTDLAEIKKVCEEMGAKCHFTLAADAEEYRQTLSLVRSDDLVGAVVEDSIVNEIDEIRSDAA